MLPDPESFARQRLPDIVGPKQNRVIVQIKRSDLFGEMIPQLALGTLSLQEQIIRLVFVQDAREARGPILVELRQIAAIFNQLRREKEASRVRVDQAALAHAPAKVRPMIGRREKSTR